MLDSIRPTWVQGLDRLCHTTSCVPRILGSGVLVPTSLADDSRANRLKIATAGCQHYSLGHSGRQQNARHYTLPSKIAIRQSDSAVDHTCQCENLNVGHRGMIELRVARPEGDVPVWSVPPSPFAAPTLEGYSGSPSNPRSPLGSAGAAVEVYASPHFVPTHRELEEDPFLVGLVALCLRCQQHCRQQHLDVNSDQKHA